MPQRAAKTRISIKPNFQIQRMLTERVGDALATYKLLIAYGYQVDYMTCYQWYYRGFAPTKWVLTLLALREIETGEPISFAPYLK